MFDAGLPYDAAPKLQRARGALEVTVRRRDGGTVLEDLRQEGCLKARFPRGGPAGWHETVVLNASGGVAAGDRLSLRFRLRSGARASMAAQAAERFYRASPGDDPALVRAEVRLEPGAAFEWLPQETIVYDNAALDRALDVDMAADASFLAVESLVFGRSAMGERVQRAMLRDRVRVRRGGRLIWHDAVRLTGDIAPTLARKAVANGAGAAASIVYVAPDAEAALTPARAALDDADAGASAWDGMLVARLLAADGAALRRLVVALLAVLRGARSLPRVWRC
ncbi:MAG: urease accessory protein UreD [Rhodospirillales bacterium]|nr:urease accessory protein UreD [Rhodospirillales bacterium]